MRNKKISADISIEAKLLLDAVCKKHDRSKGFLLEKMIRKFCGDEVVSAPVVVAANIATVEKKPVKRFVPPTPLEIDAYMVERGVNDPNEAQSIFDFYESKGWVVGKAKMKCWKAATRNWLKNYKAKSNTDILATSSASDWHLEEDKGF